ncbi:hypothetical protein EXIGLDRAFT_765279 [Exidia glandulosa HHB12029]|uniref:Uncharacterized protein n=2 Tax=Exidia glandulosa HHB12029 TaxID=1314781 RepID=A0A165KK87_EXIGL|nr:hypothetical protein EXIGLDRAFT_765279 [Exidia glandulosa HHB12029]
MAMYPPHITAGSDLTVQGSYYSGVPPSSAYSSQSLSQAVTSTSGPAGDATGVASSMQNVTVAYNFWLQHVAPYMGVAQGANELDPPDKFWEWFSAQGLPSHLVPNQAPAPAHAQGQVQAPAGGVLASTQSTVAGLRQPLATALGSRRPALGPYAYGMTAAPGGSDGRSQSQAGSAPPARRRSSIRIDGPLTIVLQGGARAGSGNGGQK